jgi:purine-binding chemotaxis protein CheW
MKGVINIRGSVVPVIDLRLKFGMEEGEKTVDTAIIVMDINAEDTTITAGCLADSVQEVIDILPESIEGAPKLGTKVDTNFIQGMGKKDEQFIIILDIDKVFQQDELQAVEQGKRLADTPVAATAT